MFEYKLKASVLVFSLVVTMTGSMVTIGDWEQLSMQQKIEIIEKNTELNADEKSLLTDMLVSGEEDAQKMEKVFLEKAKQLRLEASKVINPIKKIKLKDAANSFEQSVQRLNRIKGLENSLNDLQKKYADRNYTPELKISIERSINRLLVDYEKEKGELKLSLVQGFLSVKAAKNAENILQEKADVVAENKPKLSDIGFFGPITLVIGFLGSGIAGLKLIIDYKKARIDLMLAKLKLQEAQK